MLRNHKIILVATFAVLALTGFPQVPVYQIDRSVIANGGGTSSSGGFRVEGTIGQSAAGERMAGGSFNQVGGFWQPLPLAPTAASVTVSGRVQTRNGRAISSAIVTISDMFGTRRLAITNTFGYFRFVDIDAGESYLVQVTARAYTFEPRLVSVEQDLVGLTFTAGP
jgi:Carboxypeptidase regulatory-like domain